MSAYLSPDVVVVIGHQRQQVIESPVSRLRLARPAEPTKIVNSGPRRIDLKSALLTRSGAVSLASRSRRANRQEWLGSPGSRLDSRPSG